MSYEKQTWQTGDTITATKLNHMEDGIAGGGEVLVCVPDDDTGALDHTWQEIYDATLVLLKEPNPEVISNGGYAIFVAHDIDAPKVGPNAGKYLVGFGETLDYVSETADDYPVLQED